MSIATVEVGGCGVPLIASSKARGGAYFGNGGRLAHIIQPIGDDEQHIILTVSGLTPELHELEGTCLSLPLLIGAAGILVELRLDPSYREDQELRPSPGMLRRALHELGF